MMNGDITQQNCILNVNNAQTREKICPKIKAIMVLYRI